ncbi:MAG TPA: winged helix DNA-binding domain-containing protein [Candidatus Binatia bacterium]|nr:winged helix DNA-binding domain-containing protein [Candidatus Binatia bacterium]
MAEARLTARHLNRALLERQMLLERSALELTQVVERMGGIQTQYAPAGYIGLWSRMRDFERPMLTRALEERRVVQGTMMRATIHTVSAADYWPLMAGVRRVNREWYTKVRAREMAGFDLEAVAGAVRAELSDGPLRFAELTRRLVERGFPARAAGWAGTWVDLVRVPPSGTWERRRADLYGLADAWLPRVEVSEEDGIERLIRRYLGAFGPGPLRDIAGWMGLNVGQMRDVAERMDLRPWRDEQGRPLLDLPDAPLPDPETPAPARFIAVWDAMLLVHARRTQVLPEEYRPHVFNTKTPHSHNVFLLDGQVAGTWRFTDGRIDLSPLRPLTSAEGRALDEEASRLAAFHA